MGGSEDLKKGREEAPRHVYGEDLRKFLTMCLHRTCNMHRCNNTHAYIVRAREMYVARSRKLGREIRGPKLREQPSGVRGAIEKEQGVRLWPCILNRRILHNMLRFVDYNGGYEQRCVSVRRFEESFKKLWIFVLKWYWKIFNYTDGPL